MSAYTCSVTIHADTDDDARQIIRQVADVIAVDEKPAIILGLSELVPDHVRPPPAPLLPTVTFRDITFHPARVRRVLTRDSTLTAVMGETGDRISWDARSWEFVPVMLRELLVVLGWNEVDTGDGRSLRDFAAGAEPAPGDIVAYWRRQR